LNSKRKDQNDQITRSNVSDLNSFRQIIREEIVKILNESDEDRVEAFHKEIKDRDPKILGIAIGFCRYESKPTLKEAKKLRIKLEKYLDSMSGWSDVGPDYDYWKSRVHNTIDELQEIENKLIRR